MKKVISFVVAIALVLSMSVCAFAAEKPTGTDVTPESIGAYYVELLNDPNADIPAIAAELVDDLGLFSDPADAVELVIILNQGVDPEVMNQFMEEVEKIAGVELPDIPSGNPDEEESSTEESTTLEEDTSDTGSTGGMGSFLDTILGVLGGLGDILFGGGGETPETTTQPDTTWPSEPSSTENGPSQTPNTGDTSVVAVATIALVAGAALVLTRKKSDDAE